VAGFQRILARSQQDARAGPAAEADRGILARWAAGPSSTAQALLRARISAQIRYRQTANSQVGDLYALQTAEGVTSQV
jgi:hypothetical protein